MRYVIGENMATFRDWLREQQEARGYSVPEFARFLDIGVTTLRSFIRDQEPLMPSGRILLKIAKATNVNLESLVTYLDPEAAERIKQSSGRAQFFAELLDSLSDEQAEVVFNIIETMRRQNERQ